MKTENQTSDETWTQLRDLAFNEKLRKLSSTGESPEKFAGLFDVNRVSSELSIEKPEIDGTASVCNPRLPFSGPAMKISTLKPYAISADAICQILGVRGLSQIFNSIIGWVAVDVINEKRGPSTINPTPNNAMNQEKFAIDIDASISLDPNSTSNVVRGAPPTFDIATNKISTRYVREHLPNAGGADEGFSLGGSEFHFELDQDMAALRIGCTVLNVMEFLKRSAPAETRPAAAVAPTGALPGEDATAEIMVPTRRGRLW